MMGSASALTENTTPTIGVIGLQEAASRATTRAQPAKDRQWHAWHANSPLGNLSIVEQNVVVQMVASIQILQIQELAIFVMRIVEPAPEQQQIAWHASTVHMIW